MLTGESMPVTKVEEDSVVGATINLNGLIEVKVTKREEDSVLASIIKAVEDAQGTKAPIQRMADKIANYFVPIVVGIAVLTFIVWIDRKSTRLNSSHVAISYAVFCLK